MKPACRKARKEKCHRNWLGKNPDFYKLEKHKIRVRNWRAKKRLAAAQSHVDISTKHAEQGGRSASQHARHPFSTASGSGKMSLDRMDPLLDSMTRNPLIIGLVAVAVGSSSREDIVIACKALIAKGNAILKSR